MVTGPSGVVNCASSQCVYSFFPDESVTLYAVPVFGGTFQSFTGDCSVNPCVLVIDGDKTVHATFD